MKKRNYYLFALTVFVFALPIGLISNDEYNARKYFNEFDANNLKIALVSSFGNNYEEIINKNSLLTNNAKELENIMENLMFTKKEEIQKYGGIYINDNNELVIQVVDKSLLQSSKILSDFIVHNKVIINKIENSLSDLEETNAKIINRFLNGKYKNDNFIGNYIDIKNNVVVVELLNNCLSEQKKFKDEVVNSDLVMFVENNIPMPTASYKAGQTINSTSVVETETSIINYNRTCSIGFRAKLNGSTGYVTAGHCIDNVNDKFNNGVTKKRIFTQSMDAAFVQLNSGNSISNDLYKTGFQASFLNTSLNGYFVVGTTVGKVGSESSYQTGSVTALNYSMNAIDNVTKKVHYYTNLVKTNVHNKTGDSGGPVFLINTTTLKQGATLLGISVAGANEDDQACFYRADQVISALGVTRY